MPIARLTTWFDDWMNAVRGIVRRMILELAGQSPTAGELEGRILDPTVAVDPELAELCRRAVLLADLTGRSQSIEAVERKRGQGSGIGDQGSEMRANAEASAAAGDLFAKLPFQEAIRSFLNRHPILKERFLELDAAARSESFTMARVWQDGLLAEIKEDLDHALTEGETFRDFWLRLEQTAKDSDWIGTTQCHARLVYEINVGQAYNTGRGEQGAEYGLNAWRVVATTSDTPRAEHEQYVGQVFKYLPGLTPFPPWDFGCNCGWEWVFPEELEEMSLDPASLPECVPPPTDNDFVPALASQKRPRMKKEPPMNADFNGPVRPRRSETTDLVTCEAVVADGLPRRVLLVPWGEVRSTNGDFVCDTESAAKTIQAFEAQGVDLPIDYEHHSMGGTYAAPDGTARAAGWIKRIEAVHGEGIIGFVDWTDRAKGLLAGKEYRYLSPVVLVRKSDRKVVALHSVALTNKPAIAGMRPIVNRAGAGNPESGARDRGPGVLAVLTEALTHAARGESADGPFIRRFAMNANLANARQIIEASKLPAEEKQTLLKLWDTVPDELVANKAALEPLGKMAADLGEDGKPLAEAIAKGDGAAAAAAVGVIVNRQKLLGDELKTTSERLKAVEQASTEQAWETFFQANSAKIPPAEKDDLHAMWHKDRQFIEKIVANRAAQVRTEPVKTAGGAVGEDRTAIINSARAEYRGNAELHKLCSERAAVADALRQKNLPPVTDDEAAKLQLVA